MRHDPKKRMISIAGLGRRFWITCPCGNVPGRRLDANEAEDEMRKHPVAGAR